MGVFVFIFNKKEKIDDCLSKVLGVWYLVLIIFECGL